MSEHLKAIFVIQRQDDLTVGIRGKLPAFGFKRGAHRAEAVKFAVADNAVPAAGERLHAGFGQAHDGQPAEAEPAELGLQHTVVVRPAAGRTQQIPFKLLPGEILPGIPQHTTHKRHILSYRLLLKTSDKKGSALVPNKLRTNRCLIRGAT